MNYDIDKKISHLHWSKTLEELYLALSMSSPGDIISLVGASRTGKTKLLHSVISMMDGPNVREDGSYINSIYRRAYNAGGNGVFCSKYFAWSLLDSFNHPVYSFGEEVKAFSNLYARTPEAVFHAAFSKAIEHLQVRYVFVDEFQHVDYTPGAVIGPKAVMDSWKTMAEEANIVLILCGSYYLLEIIARSGHLLGREDTIILPRYSDSSEDLDEYASIICQMEKSIPVHLFGESLVAHTRYIQQYTFGCIGLLRKWIKRTVRYAAMTGRKVDLDILRETRVPQFQFNVMQAEIQLGEALLDNETEISSSESSLESEGPVGRLVSRKNVKPFKAKPKRYKPSGRME